MSGRDFAHSMVASVSLHSVHGYLKRVRLCTDMGFCLVSNSPFYTSQESASGSRVYSLCLTSSTSPNMLALTFSSKPCCV